MNHLVAKRFKPIPLSQNSKRISDYTHRCNECSSIICTNPDHLFGYNKCCNSHHANHNQENNTDDPEGDDILYNSCPVCDQKKRKKSKKPKRFNTIPDTQCPCGKKICIFHKNKRCTFGINCRNCHNVGNETKSCHHMFTNCKCGKKICIFHKNKRCTFGINCRNCHNVGNETKSCHHMFTNCKCGKKICPCDNPISCKGNKNEFSHLFTEGGNIFCFNCIQTDN